MSATQASGWSRPAAAGIVSGRVNPGAARFAEIGCAACPATFLHDGRADSIAEAIAEHGGEAERAVAAFERLPQDEQAAVEAFVLAL